VKLWNSLNHFYFLKREGGQGSWQGALAGNLGAKPSSQAKVDPTRFDLQPWLVPAIKTIVPATSPEINKRYFATIFPIKVFGQERSKEND
jgi:hypothetical protein